MGSTTWCLIRSKSSWADMSALLKGVPQVRGDYRLLQTGSARSTTRQYLDGDDGFDFPFARFKPPSLDGQISSSQFLVHCSDVVRRQSRGLLAQAALCRLTHAED